ncbi:MAG TPA: ATP-binding protein [Blastocatellia bacterium]
MSKDSKQNKGAKDSGNASRQRRTTVVVLSIIVLLLLLSLVAQSAFNPSPFVTPDTAAETLLLYALSSLNFLAFVTVLFILIRNLLKLVRERRTARPGSRFKLRLVSYAIGLSLLPALLLFFFAFGLLNRSIDRWFGEPARQIVDDAQAIEQSYFRDKQDRLIDSLTDIASNIRPPAGSAIDDQNLRRLLESERANRGLVLLKAGTESNNLEISGEAAAPEAGLDRALAEAEQSAARNNAPFSTRYTSPDNTADYVIAALPVEWGSTEKGALAAASRIPPEITARAANITEQHENFHSLLGKVRRIKAIYLLLLGSVTLLLIFSASWLALYVARGITVPIQALAEATGRVASGDFDHPVDVVAEDELAALVNSFNQMATMLAENRERLEHAAETLGRANLALDNRRRYIETVLESLSTGVISTDERTAIATINSSALEMLGLSERPEIGTPIGKLTESDNQFHRLCLRARRSKTAQAEIEYRRPDGSTILTSTTAIALRSVDGRIEGFVIVIEDLTDLIQAERAAAWSEVARRMAHEIKNPLTPIQLSAERIMRNYGRGPEHETRFADVVREGTATIVREVSSLQRMVEEFSRFARLPEANPVSTSVNDVVRNAVDLYADRLEEIKIRCDMAGDIPALKLDPEQIKQVLVNLIDNAIEALKSEDHGGNGGGNGGAGKGVISIESRYMKMLEVVRIIVSDSGHGIHPRDRDKLFLPKFSTRKRGTGLGLAIVSHIIADHKGRIWIEDNKPRGARFIIELPVTRPE